MIKIHFDIYCKINKTMPVALAQKLKKKKNSDTSELSEQHYYGNFLRC